MKRIIHGIIYVCAFIIIGSFCYKFMIPKLQAQILFRPATQHQLFQGQMNKLWMQQSFLLDRYWLALEQKRPNLESYRNCLVGNKIEIGQAIGRFFGQVEGDTMGALLVDRLNVAIAVIDALENRQPDISALNRDWQRVNEEVVNYMVELNTKSDREKVSAVLNNQVAFAQAKVAKNEARWEDELRSFDEHISQALAIAEQFSRLHLMRISPFYDLYS